MLIIAYFEIQTQSYSDNFLLIKNLTDCLFFEMMRVINKNSKSKNYKSETLETKQCLNFKL